MKTAFFILLFLVGAFTLSTIVRASVAQIVLVGQ